VPVVPIPPPPPLQAPPRPPAPPPPAPAPLPPNTPIYFNESTPPNTGCLVTPMDPSQPVYLSNAINTSCTPYVPINPSSPSQPIQPNSPVIIRDNQTGLYCRVVTLTPSLATQPLVGSLGRTRLGTSGRAPPAASIKIIPVGTIHPSSTAGTCSNLGLACDQTSMATATQLNYTGSTFTYNGSTLSGVATSQPALFCPPPSPPPPFPPPGVTPAPPSPQQRGGDPVYPVAGEVAACKQGGLQRIATGVATAQE
jgi:hypothetical protein